MSHLPPLPRRRLRYVGAALTLRVHLRDSTRAMAFDRAEHPIRSVPGLDAADLLRSSLFEEVLTPDEAAARHSSTTPDDYRDLAQIDSPDGRVLPAATAQRVARAARAEPPIDAEETDA
ncbi:MAG: hypothetical protein AAGN46_13800 [Acidobacteriota bacterium]